MCAEIRHTDAFNQELDKYFFHHWEQSPCDAQYKQDGHD